MCRAFVYSILAGLFVAVNSSMALPSNIYEKMTSAERFAVFGSNDSVSEYKVFPLPLPGARSRRKADKNINLELEVDGRRIILDLKPTMGYLATKYTPVWSAESDANAFNDIRYVPLPTAMSGIGEFKMYHDVKNEAAVIIYDDPIEGSIMEGIFTAYYAIKSLPKRLMTELLTEGPHLVQTSAWGKRSIISDPEAYKGYEVLELPTALKDVKNRSLADMLYLRREKSTRHKAGKRKIPKVVYPEIFIVIDISTTSKHNLTEILRFTLAFWNGVDLIYRAHHKPKVFLSIAGIIIAENVNTTPYIVKNALSADTLTVDNVLSGMGTYFYTERVRFPMKRYDIIISMTEYALLYLGGHVYNDYLNGYNAPNAHACSSTREASKTKIIGNTGIVHYDWKYSGVRTAAYITAHLLGAKDMRTRTTPDCPSLTSLILPEFTYDNNQKMEWSICSRRDFSRYFSSKESLCLKNKPLWRKQVGKVLPGRWLTLDGQCQNEGYAKACKLKKLSTCAAKGCQAKGSSKCVRSKQMPLPGSTCGTKKHCSAKKKCVHD